MNKELVFKDEVRTTILKHAPGAAFAINRIKTVDALPVVHATWEKSNVQDDVWGGFWFRWKCSNCGHIIFHSPTGVKHYCENCGAKMDGETVGQDV